MTSELAERLKAAIRDIPDFPKQGILFRDITTLLLQPKLFAESTDALWKPFADQRVTHLAALEARGFLFASAIAVRIGIPLVLMRKPGKLPAPHHTEEYELEYGHASLEVHDDALGAGDRVVVIDDVLATGGTAAAAGRLVMACNAELLGYAFLAELDFLKGREKLTDAVVHSLVHYLD